MLQQDKIKIFEETFSSDQANRKEIIEALCKKIFSYRIPLAITEEELYLSLDEAITNAMEHGNRWDPDKIIKICVTKNSDTLAISIADQGNGFATSEIKANLKSRDILSTRGRGIYIINQFCKLSWNNKGNEIVLQIKLTG